MAKELPYFRFTLQEWQNGDITNMPDSVQGVFINVCVYYWARDCNITKEMLLNRFKTKAKTIQKLINNDIIKCQNEIISISFLDQQLLELNETHQFLSECGKRGQEAKKKKAMLKGGLKGGLSYKDKDKDKDKIKIKIKIPPSIEDVEKYIKENNYPVNANKWYDHYKAKDWYIGKNKMKDWKAAVRTWLPDKKKEEKWFD